MRLLPSILSFLDKAVIVVDSIIHERSKVMSTYFRIPIGFINLKFPYTNQIILNCRCNYKFYRLIRLCSDQKNTKGRIVEVYEVSDRKMVIIIIIMSFPVYRFDLWFVFLFWLI